MNLRTKLAAVAMVAGMTACAWAQDTRTVVEPAFPASCTVLQAQQAIVAGEPASETTLDTTRIQTALTGCPSGQAVELAGGNGNYAFLTGPLNIPSGVTLLVDGGVTLFASRNPADYQITGGETCGTVGPNGGGCNPIFKVNNNSTSSGSGIMGYGVINGRGYDKLLVNGVASTISWWDNAVNANGNGAQNNPIMISMSKANNFTLYKITLMNSPMFHVGWKGTGFTAWGVKIITPYTGRNTDGIDPDGTNVSILNSSISDGDDDVAVGASSAAANVTVQNVNTYSGHGISVGSYTQGGLTNFFVDHVNMAGTAADGNTNAIRLKSAADRGGLLNNITYQNICIKDSRHPLQLNPIYNTNTGTLLPQFKNVILRNVHVLTEGLVQLQGYDVNHTSTITFDNVVFEILKTTDLSPAPQYDAITLGPGPVFPALLQTLPGTGISYTGTAPTTTTGAYSCPSSVFPYIVGELYASTASATNLQTVSAVSGTAITLNAMVQPAMSQVSYGAWMGTAALSKPINFLEGTAVVGTGSVGLNGTIASFATNALTPGVHVLTAQYPGDTVYPLLNFGSVTVTITGTTASSTVLTATPTGSTYGTSSALKATVTGAGATGTVTFLDGGVTLGTATLAGGSATLNKILTGGTHSLTAIYAGDNSFAASTSSPLSYTVAAAATTTTLSAPATLAFGSSETLTATATSAVTTAALTGLITFFDGTRNLGTAAPNVNGVATFAVSPSAISHSFTATYGGDSNFAASTSAAAVTVVSQAPTTTTLAVSATPITPGTSETFTATVTDATTSTPTGTVTFADGSGTLGTGTLVAGVATFVTTTLAAGTHNVTATYGGDINFATSVSAAASVVVNGVAQTVTFATLPTTAVYSATGIVVTATASSGLAVTLSVTSGPGTLSGTASGSTLTLTGVGTVVLKASQAGNSTNAPASATANIVVTAAPLTVVANNASRAFGVANPTFTGTVTGVVGSDGITATYATTATTASAVGTYPITATVVDPNSKLANYTVTNTPGVLTVTAAAPTVVVTAAPTTVLAGFATTLSATVTATGGTVTTGTVTFLDGSATLGTGTVNASGIASFAFTTTVLGTHSITASYAANGNYSAAVSAAQVVTVVAPVALGAGTATVTLGPGASGTSTITVTPTAGFTGVVTLTCASPATYVTCTMNPTSVTISGTTAATSVATVTVAATLGGHSGVLTAMLAPFAALLLLPVVRKRIGVRLVVLALVMGCGFLSLTGCGGGGAAAANLPPVGLQTMTVTGTTSGGASQTTTFVVNVTH